HRLSERCWSNLCFICVHLWLAGLADKAVRAPGVLVRQTPMPDCAGVRISRPVAVRHASGVRETKSKAVLPIGRTAQIAFQIEALRADCCAAAQILAT